MKALILAAAIVLLALICVDGQGPRSRYEFVRNYRGSWYHAYWNCTARGGSIANIRNNDPELLRYKLNLANEFTRFERYRENEWHWGSEWCQTWSLQNGQIRSNPPRGCYHWRSWICQFPA